MKRTIFLLAVLTAIAAIPVSHLALRQARGGGSVALSAEKSA